jgi:hypothetical protein
MRSIGLILLFFPLFFLTFSCKSQKQTVAGNQKKFDASQTFSNYEFQTAEENDTVIATLQRTPCYGTCPIFQITIFKSGLIFYHGDDFVELKGKYYYFANMDEIKSIFEKANSIGYFDLKDNYDMPISDFPSTITSIALNGKVKQIYNRAGGPKELTEFEKFFEQLVLSKSLIPIN